ncbi:hypothetical protein B0H16DRAFT_1466034 [Mycena metata]|uniref:Uncharacterized protein n=1 Tax=Mycena metata TaxID=1033252 RepID=A0AAD7MXR6_9AGAR|nr:hypothetical protein B0H16DRAFT_1466034 [Mycena metata]
MFRFLPTYERALTSPSAPHKPCAPRCARPVISTPPKLTGRVASVLESMDKSIIEIDRFMACEYSQKGRKLALLSLVLRTWSRTLLDEAKLPKDWLAVVDPKVFAKQDKHAGTGSAEPFWGSTLPPNRLGSPTKSTPQNSQVQQTEVPGQESERQSEVQWSTPVAWSRRVSVNNVKPVTQRGWFFEGCKEFELGLASPEFIPSSIGGQFPPMSDYGQREAISLGIHDHVARQHGWRSIPSHVGLWCVWALDLVPDFLKDSAKPSPLVSTIT